MIQFSFLVFLRFFFYCIFSSLFNFAFPIFHPNLLFFPSYTAIKVFIRFYTSFDRSFIVPYVLCMFGSFLQFDNTVNYLFADLVSFLVLSAITFVYSTINQYIYVQYKLIFTTYYRIFPIITSLYMRFQYHTLNNAPLIITKSTC